MKAFKRSKGMTLVEIMVASAISLIVVTGGLRFLIQTLKTYQYETGKLMVNRDIRKFTTQMVDDATYASYFLIYDQVSNLTRSTGIASGGVANPCASNYRGYAAELTTTDPANPVSSTAPGTSDVKGGLPGDVLVFVYNQNGDNTKIYQLIIYYRSIATTAGGTNGTNSTTVSSRTSALRRVVVTIDHSAWDDPTWAAAGIMKLLPDLANVPTTTSAINQTLFPYVDGQAHDGDETGGAVNRVNKMFYNVGDISVLVRGRIYENYTAQRLVKSTYNFTVTPRG